jgi:hypothetical protein
LKAIAFADPREAVTWAAHITESEDEDDDGDVVRVTKTVSNSVLLKNAEDLPRSIAHAIKSITQDKDGNVRVQFHDKAPALQLLARHLGMAAGSIKIEHGGTVRHAHAHVMIDPETHTPKDAAEAWRDMLTGD